MKHCILFVKFCKKATILTLFYNISLVFVMCVGGGERKGSEKRSNLYRKLKKTLKSKQVLVWARTEIWNYTLKYQNRIIFLEFKSKQVLVWSWTEIWNYTLKYENRKKLFRI